MLNQNTSTQESMAENQTFSQALERIKEGYSVQRKGWNGKDMWICLGKGHEGLEAEKFWNPHTRAFAEKNGGKAEVLPYLIMKTADNKVLMGWLASQSDILANDWQVCTYLDPINA